MCSMTYWSCLLFCFYFHRKRRSKTAHRTKTLERSASYQREGSSICRAGKRIQLSNRSPKCPVVSGRRTQRSSGDQWGAAETAVSLTLEVNPLLPVTSQPRSWDPWRVSHGVWCFLPLHSHASQTCGYSLRNEIAFIFPLLSSSGNSGLSPAHRSPEVRAAAWNETSWSLTAQDTNCSACMLDGRNTSTC